jgi:hypothetical protein
MDEQDLWRVKIGSGLGPLALGTSRRKVLESLQAFGWETNPDLDRHKILLRIPKLEISLSFAEDGSEILRRIDVSNPRVSFATWDVIGKPIHKAVRLFKCAAEETLWCSAYDESSQRDLALSPTGQSNLQQPDDVALLRRGTLWIPPLGLGFTLSEGRIVTLHVTKPEYAPKFGTGTWNVAQKTMSELGRIPKFSRTIASAEDSRTKRVRNSLTILLTVALGMVAWRAIELQRRWNALPDIPATVIAVVPPPPAPFGDQFQLRYLDESGRVHEVALERMAFFDQPKLDSIVHIRYLPEAPDEPLGDRRLADVGMTYGLPRAAVVVAMYAGILLIFELIRFFRKRWE